MHLAKEDNYFQKGNKHYNLKRHIVLIENLDIKKVRERQI